MMKIWFFGLILIVFACESEPPSEGLLFNTIDSHFSGVDFSNNLTPTKELNILSYLYYYNGAGVAAADFNNDGLEDLYFVGNQVQDRLFINLGDFRFRDVTEMAEINNADGWSFGVTIVDINSDGLLDIYISKVGNHDIISGRNLLYINNGVREGIPEFTEEAKTYGLDISSYCTQTAFFDFDLDGDLDAYVLNHSVHPNRTYGSGNKRHQVDSLAGDRLLENRDGFFIDVSEAAGINQGPIGYGLDISIGDLNEDGYPDIFVGNDFFENDYLYINDRGMGFFERISSEENPLGHTSHFSMGNVFFDSNNDGRMDILSLDMLPENLVDYKTSGTEFPYPTYNQYLKNNYQPQYMQNALHLSTGDHYTEVAFQAGVSATEWSWAALTADYDLDGFKDIFITNGIPGATNDMDYIKFASQDIVQEEIEGSGTAQMDLIDQIPDKKVSNYLFKGSLDNYTNVSAEWMKLESSFSSGAVHADLDNDGDLDLIVNNINQEAKVLENKANETVNNFLKVDLVGPSENRFGIGVRVKIYVADQVLMEDVYPNKSYLSSSSYRLIFGLGKMNKIDSLKVYWPDGMVQAKYDVQSNQFLTLDYSNAASSEEKEYLAVRAFEKVEHRLPFAHEENSSIDFDREILAPYAKSNEGPTLAVADVNGDGKDDIFFGGAKGQKSQLWIQDDRLPRTPFDDRIQEATSSHFFDFDNDEDLDLVVGYGGNEFRKGKALQPDLYINQEGTFAKSDRLGDVELHASKISSIDYDRDGDQDLLMVSNTVVGEFGLSGKNYLLENQDGAFIDVTESKADGLSGLGLVEDFEIVDLDDDGFEEVVFVGHWMPITIFENDGSSLRKSHVIEDSEGWWNTVSVADFDKDGDFDILAGNWGNNSRLTASPEEPLRLYRADFDGNGKIDPVVTYYYQGVETTIASKDELVKQMPVLNKDFLTYRSFAEASIEQVFGKHKLRNARQKSVFELRSMFYKNTGSNNFVGVPLPAEVQVSAVQDVLVEDIDQDGFLDAIVVGNNYQISTQLGRLDALLGVVLRNEGNGEFSPTENLGIVGASRAIEPLSIGGTKHYLIGINDEKPILVRRKNE